MAAYDILTIGHSNHPIEVFFDAIRAAGGTELVERHPVLDAVMADAVAEGRELDSGGHSLSITKESQLFTPRISESGTLVRRK